MTSTSASTSAGFAPRAPSSSAIALELAQHPADLVAAERRHAERDVAEHLDEHAAEPGHHHRSEQRVLGDADDHLDAAAHLLADEDAVDVAVLPDGAAGLARSGRRRSSRTSLSEPTPTFTSPRSLLCSSVRRRRLHHDRVAERASRPAPLRRRRAQHVAASCLMPYAFSSCFDSCSESATAGRRALEDLAGALRRGERLRSARRRTASGSARTNAQ